MITYISGHQTGKENDQILHDIEVGLVGFTCW